MKYTFDKFQIQLVTKPNPSFRKNAKNPHLCVQVSGSNKRNIRTAEYTHRKNPSREDELFRKSIDHEINFDNKNENNITRSQSLKSQIKDRYKSWLNYSSVGTSLKQKQYKIFKQKCIDLLSKKKINSQSQKRTDQKNQQKPKLLFCSSQTPATQQKHSSVQQMMNNIIQKFKSESRQRNYIFKEIKKSQQNPEQQPFITISNDFYQQPENQLKSSLQNGSMFHVVKSTEMRRISSVQNKSQVNKKNIRDDIFQSNQCEVKIIHKSWKEAPNFSGIKTDKQFNKQSYPAFNPLICTSLALNSQARDLRKNIMAFQHIKLSPYQRITSASTGKFSKRKKIHLNKPSVIKKFMKFTKNTSDDQYNKKIKSYLDFLFKINFSNNIYVSLQLAPLNDTCPNIQNKYKVYVGPGNNSLLIKSLLMRREWIEVVENINEEGIQFYWTQNKINEVHSRQIRSDTFRQPRIQTQKQSDKKKSPLKTMAQSKEMNLKILPVHKSEDVQNYIFSDGYEIPFEKDYEPNILTNHIPDNYVIGSKKNLFKSMFSYYTSIAQKDPFTVIPKTYHIKSPEDPEFKRFVKQNSKQPKKLWIVKPGQNTNRGNGIRLVPFSKIQALIKQKIRHPNGRLMTYIVQSYINRPFLYNGRKFDIRHYMLITSVNGYLKVYWYRDGYIRTSSELYDLEDHDNQFIHLTNDAIQQKSQTYGKYQDANKLSYTEFQRYLDYSFPGRGYSFDNIVKEMKSIMIDVIKASYLNLDQDRRKDNFELFGFDFMIDNNFKPYLIQINFNPCLVVNCNILNRIIPPLIENTLRIGLDPLLTNKNHLPVNKRHNLSQNYLKNLRYELIFDQATLQTDIFNKPDLEDSQDQQEQYCDNGKELPENITF